MISFAIIYDDSAQYLPLLLQSMEGIQALQQEVFIVAPQGQQVPQVSLLGKKVPVYFADGEKPALYNVAMTKANGEWVAFCKADICFEKGFFSTLAAKKFAENTVYCARQVCVEKIGGSLLGWNYEQDSLWYAPGVFSDACRKAGYPVYEFSESCFVLPKAEGFFDESFKSSLFEYAAILSRKMQICMMEDCTIHHRDVDYLEKISARNVDLLRFTQAYPQLTETIREQAARQRQQEFCQQKQQLEDLQRAYDSKAAHVEQLIQSEQSLQEALERANTQIQQERESFAQEKQEMTLLAEESSKKISETLQKLQRDFDKKDSELREKILQNITLEEQARKVPGLEQHCANLSSMLNQVYASRTWRYPHRMATIFRKIFPAHSLRGKAMVAVLRAPIRFEHALRAIPRKHREKVAEKKRKKAEMLAKLHWFENLQPLYFSEKEDVEVSIIIPVYNQVEYTYNCLKSIQDTCRGVSYEIIIADDNSTDDTKRLQEKVHGINIVRNSENLRFLRNCNNAALQANGKFIVFLNNDTIVHKDWLQSMLRTMDEHPDCGMVGSKLVFANGTLQEAGGIVWNNANAWNYGRGQDPERPEFNYLKEVDYISGCSIMIRTQLWQEIGGFDDRFAPAYYEDTDLAFEVRAHGYKVLYQPQSVLTHFEGISNGTDLAQGQKAYQVLNREKFYEKWQDVLQKEQFDDATDVFLARDRSRNRSVVLITDYSVPHYDKDAGSKCTTMYTHLFASLGLKVIFMGDNFYRYEPYCGELQQAGIEVLYGDDYYLHWKEWLKENGKYITYAYMNRPDFTIKYIDAVKQYTPAKIIYFGHDLHHLRLQREYELNGNKELLPQIEKFRAIEYHLFEQANTIYVVGSYEQKFLKERFPQKPIYNIPVYIYDKPRNDIDRDFEKRQNILFVGSFGHPPNADAVLWFAKNVFPHVLEKNPEMKWVIVGSRAPQAVQDLAGPNIIVTGFISDEELEKYYETCRMAVIPLRVGAGVKGKVIEAAYNGLPILTSPIGAEGLSTEEGAMRVVDVTDDGTAMTQALDELYNSPQTLKQMSLGCEKFIEKYFTSDVAKNILLKDVKKETLR